MSSAAHYRLLYTMGGLSVLAASVFPDIQDIVSMRGTDRPTDKLVKHCYWLTSWKSHYTIDLHSREKIVVLSPSSLLPSQNITPSHNWLRLYTLQRYDGEVSNAWTGEVVLAAGQLKPNASLQRGLGCHMM